MRRDGIIEDSGVAETVTSSSEDVSSFYIEDFLIMYTGSSEDRIEQNASQKFEIIIEMYSNFM